VYFTFDEYRKGKCPKRTFTRLFQACDPFWHVGLRRSLRFIWRLKLLPKRFSVIGCCVDKRGLEVCSQCADLPCKKYEDRAKIERDSFVSHKRIFHNHEMIKTKGLDAFLSEQDERIGLLRDMLTNYDDGRSKNYFCLAASLLSIKSPRTALSETAIEDDVKSNARVLKLSISKCAEIEKVDLALKK
jgi:hypothetical protein